MLQPEDVRNGIALRPLRDNLDLRAAVEGYLARRRDDLFGAWARAQSPEDEKKFTKDFCRGALDVIDGLLVDLDSIIEDSEETRKAEAAVREDEADALLGRGEVAE